VRSMGRLGKTLEARLERRRTILTILEEHATQGEARRGITLPELCKATEMGRASLQPILEDLLEEGRVCTSADGTLRYFPTPPPIEHPLAYEQLDQIFQSLYPGRRDTALGLHHTLGFPLDFTRAALETLHAQSKLEVRVIGKLVVYHRPSHEQAAV